MPSEVDQFTFDYVAEFLMEQGSASNCPEHGTAYFGSYGRMCAVGCLLRKDFPSELEGVGVWHKDPDVTAYIRAEFDGASRGLLVDLQGVHDEEDPANWVDELFQVAYERGLDPGILVTWID